MTIVSDGVVWSRFGVRWESFSIFEYDLLGISGISVGLGGGTTGEFVTINLLFRH